jgi:hypothetical protein
MILSSFFKNIVLQKYMSDSNEENKRRSLLILFDIDGTIAESSQMVSQEMISKITEKRELGYDIGIVGGGTFEKATSQL